MKRRDCPEERNEPGKGCWKVSCRHHTAIEVTEQGSIRAPGMPTLRADASEEEWLEWLDALEFGEVTCSLDVAESGEHTLEEVGAIFQCTRERVRQVEGTALRKLRASKSVERMHRRVSSIRPPKPKLMDGLPSAREVKESYAKAVVNADPTRAALAERIAERRADAMRAEHVKHIAKMRERLLLS